MKKKILITVKTYPSISTKYSELVCTAGITENGEWIRLYPLPFRKLDYDRRYAKYQWIELEIEKNTSDPRPESFRPVNYDNIFLGEKIGTEKGTWAQRKEIVLQNIYTNMSDLIEDAKDKSKCVSLAVFKPTRIKSFTIKETSREWDPKKIVQFNQTNIFEDAENPFKVVSKLPYEFRYEIEDDSGKISKLMIEDWEIGQLYWNCLRRHNGDESLACEDIRKKYWDEFVFKKDLFLFLGTTQVYHFVGKNPFLIIGTFYPMK